MNITSREIASQPDVWRRSLAGLDRARELLARPGERVLVIGCGTSAFVAESFALLREQAGLGETDSAYASEPRPWRPYDASSASHDRARRPKSPRRSLRFPRGPQHRRDRCRGLAVRRARRRRAAARLRR